MTVSDQIEVIPLFIHGHIFLLQLRLTKNRKSITLKVDDDPGINGRITRRVDVIAPLYVGGIPKVYKLRDDLVSDSVLQGIQQKPLNLNVSIYGYTPTCQCVTLASYCTNSESIIEGSGVINILLHERHSYLRRKICYIQWIEHICRFGGIFMGSKWLF